MQITQTAVRRPIATAMVFLIVIVLGVMGFRFLPVDLLPPIEYPQLTVATNYPNVGPEEIERIITDQVENALAGVPNVEEIRSGSSEGRSRVTLEFTQGTNVDAAANDVRAALDRIRDDLPPEVESPRLWKFDPDNSPWWSWARVPSATWRNSRESSSARSPSASNRSPAPARWTSGAACTARSRSA